MCILGSLYETAMMFCGNMLGEEERDGCEYHKLDRIFLPTYLSSAIHFQVRESSMLRGCTVITSACKADGDKGMVKNLSFEWETAQNRAM